MLSLLLAVGFARRPLILVPGTYASWLLMTGENFQYEWYCPKTMNNRKIWIDDKDLVPPMFNCFLQWLTLYWNEETQDIENFQKSKVDVYDFGGLGGITKVDQLYKNISFIPYYKKIIDVFESHGYEEGKDLFGAPYDWRYGIYKQEGYFARLKGLVEEAFSKNNGKKVAILGHSLGGFMIQRFLAEYSDPQWVEKYVDHAFLVAPSFTGSGEAVQIAWTGALEMVVRIKTKAFTKALRSVGAVHVHFPNYALYGDDPIVTGPDGTEYTAAQYPELLHRHGKFSDEEYSMFKKNEKYIKEFPKKIPCYTTVFYNSGRKTQIGFKVNGTWDDENLERTYVGGDHTLSAVGIERYCDKYKGKDMVCHNINDNTGKGNHFAMILQNKYVEWMYQAITHH